MNVSKWFTDNDTYFIEIVSDKIIINENYEGVLILDHDLNIIKELKIISGMSIEKSFIRENEIVLSCYENQCLIHINVETYEYKVHPLAAEFEDVVFLPLCEWKNSDLMLLSDDGKVMTHIDLSNQTVKNVSREDQNGFPSFLWDAWDKISDKIIYKVYPNEGNAVVERNGQLILFDYQDDEETLLNVDPADFHDKELPSSHICHDIEVKDEIIAEVSERKVTVSYKGNKRILYPESKEYVFLRGKVLAIAGYVHLYLLQGSNSDPQKSKIERYDIRLLFHE